MTCIRCGSEATRKDGQTRLGGHCWRCNRWGRRFTARSMRAFTRHGFPDDVIGLTIRWYVRSRLSYADVVAWFTERGLVINCSTIYHWVQRFLPLFGKAACAHRRPVGQTWRVDEWDVRLNGTWPYVYRAIDEHGHVVDAYFSKRRNATAAETFFKQVVAGTDILPTRVVTDTATCYPLPSATFCRQVNIAAPATSTTALSGIMGI